MRGAALLAVVLAAPPAAADSHWYGWQTLITDGVAVSAVGGSVAIGRTNGSVSSALVTVGFLDYAVGAPIVHAAHGEPLRAGVSLVARLALPLGAGAIGETLFPCHSKAPFDCFLFGDGGLYGGLIGVGLAMALDAVVLAREDVDDTALQPRLLVLRGSF